MFLKKAKEAAKEDEAKRKIERARKAREEAKLEAMKPTQPARPVETEAQAALRKAEERKRKGPTEAQIALQKADERKRQQQEQADLNEALRRSKVDQGGFAARPQLGARGRPTARAPPGGGPGGPVGGKPRIIQTAAPKADMRIASFHEPDEFDQHWRDQKVACSYVGTFAIDVGKIDKGKILTGMRSMLQFIAQARPATLFFSREGIKVIDTTANKVAMAHALQRISMATGDAQSTLFAFVAKNPKVVDRYCHVFNMPATRTAEDCQALVMKAFRLAFASRKTSQRAKKGQPNAALAAARAAVAGKASAPAPPAQQHAPDPTRPNKQWAKHNPLQGVHLGRGQAGQAPPSAQPRMSAQIAPKRTSAGGGGGGGGAGGGGGGGNPQRVPAVGSADDAPGLGSSGWYQPGIPREIAMELLGASAEGSFIVRDSSSQPGQFALTMFAGGLMHHYIIRKVAEGVVLGSEDQGQKPLPDLPSLIIDYSRAKGCLPVVLNLDTVQPPDEEVNSSDDEDDDDDNLSFVDPDYQSMKDLR